jgi:hypothetical protein
MSNTLSLEAAVEKYNTMSSSVAEAWGAAGDEGDLATYSSLSVVSIMQKLKQKRAKRCHWRQAGDEGEYASSSLSSVAFVRQQLNKKEQKAVIGSGGQKKLTRCHHRRLRRGGQWGTTENMTPPCCHRLHSSIQNKIIKDHAVIGGSR